jgi:RNA polymerase sigma-70 factor (ECF subfamily)
VFGYTFDEISTMVGRTPADCRQIGHRARGRLQGGRPRFQAAREDVEAVTQRFVRACQEGDVGALMSVLAADVVLVSDSGGKIRAARNRIYSADRVTRFLVGLRRKLSAASLEIRVINGQPAVVEMRDGRVVNVSTFMVLDGRISTIFRVVNPDKLHYLT